ncbi:helix-turn-helix transcriptional regulator [Anaerolineales bacterium HSG6]|nr:helix-turn-helix transcriptional regulator [Anaerolineales bacterium HSG6]
MGRFGKWLQDQRKRKGFLLDEFANKTNVDVGTISRLENGRTQATLVTCISLSERLEYSAYDMYSFLQDDAEAKLDETLRPESGGIAIKQVLELLAKEQAGSIDVLQLLVDKLNGISAFALQTNAPRTFTVDDIRQFLFTSPLYSYQLHYPATMPADLVVEIYQQGGILILEDLQIYIQWLKATSETHLNRRQNSILDRLVMGNVDRIKLSDLLELDQLFEVKGELFCLVWEAVKYQMGFYRCPADMKWKRQKQSDWIELNAKQRHLTTIYLKLDRWERLQQEGK